MRMQMFAEIFFRELLTGGLGNGAMGVTGRKGDEGDRGAEGEIGE